MVFDKGRSVGGRLAARRIGELLSWCTVQTARSSRLLRNSKTGSSGVADIWCHGFESDDGLRWIGVNGMNSLAKDLADGIDVRVDPGVLSNEGTR